MARKGDDLLWKLAESDEIDIETRRDAKSPVRRTTIWIVPTEDGVYISDPFWAGRAAGTRKPWPIPMSS